MQGVQGSVKLETGVFTAHITGNTVPQLFQFPSVAGLQLSAFDQLSTSLEAFKTGYSHRRRHRKQTVTMRALD